MLRTRQGITIIELIVVMLLMAVIASVAIPRALRPTPARQVDNAAGTLARDLEQLRMRAIAAKRSMRIRFYPSGDFYTAFMDVTPGRRHTFSESAEEVRASQLLTHGSWGASPGVPLPPGVTFGSGRASSGPHGQPLSDPISLEADQLDFDPRGMVVPEGAGGIVLLTHEDDPGSVAAVTVSGAGAIRTWRYRGGRWIH